jgi:zinc transporter ZupT
MWQTLYKIDASKAGHIAFFAQHFPTEFESTAHYLKDDNGDDIEPGAELPRKKDEKAKAADDKPWGAVMGSAIIVNIVTLSGVLFLVPAIRKLSESYSDQVNGIVGGFAAGAILACAFFLLLYEATHLIATSEDWRADEVAQLWRWGTMILAGFLLPGIVDNVVAFIMPPKPAHATNSGVTPTDGENADDAKEVPEASTKARLLAGVLIGDFFHNLCDGIFLGAAFKGCGSKFGWSMTLATILHELPQEIADYVILTGPGCSLSGIFALVLNFVSGLSVILGAIIILGTDVSDSAAGLLLAFGGGVYLEIAAVECMPRAFLSKLSAKIRASATFAFILGAVLIGLILLDHEHCVPDTPGAAAADPHAGHHHR